MTDLISRQAAIDAIGITPFSDYGDYMRARGLIEDLPSAQPTVDAVPAVRCNDCKHYDGYYCHNKNWGDGYGNYAPPIKAEGGFCDWAEPKEME